MRIAVVGAGWMGGVHARAIAAAGDSVAVIVDSDPERAGALAATHDASASTDLGAATGCDAAVIATPSAFHLDQAAVLAAEGVPLLVEKPHRLPSQDPAPLRAALTRGGAVYRVGLTTRFHPGLQRLKAALDAGALGHILSYSDTYHFQLDPQTLSAWYFDPVAAGGGVVTTNGVHLIDRAAWLLDGPPQLVEARGLVPLIAGHRVEDHARITLTVGGRMVDLSLLWSPFETAPPDLRVIGESGMARIGLEEWRIDTAGETDRGRIDFPEAAFVAQWRAFRDGLRDSDAEAEANAASAIPDFDAMEATMRLIGDIYDRSGRAQ